MAVQYRSTYFPLRMNEESIRHLMLLKNFCQFLFKNMHKKQASKTPHNTAGFQSRKNVCSSIFPQNFSRNIQPARCFAQACEEGAMNLLLFEVISKCAKQGLLTINGLQQFCEFSRSFAINIFRIMEPCQMGSLECSTYGML